MKTKKRTILPTGLQPWDPINGLRVGAIAGAAVGAVAVAVSGVANFWVIALPAVVGAGLGYWSEKRRQRGGT